MVKALDELRRTVLSDPALCQRLRDISDRPAFITAVAALARDRGLAIDADGIAEALAAARRQWLERWV